MSLHQGRTPLAVSEVDESKLHPEPKTDTPKPPKERIIKAVKDRDWAKHLEQQALECLRRGDTVSARIHAREAEEVGKAADTGLDHWSYTTRRPGVRGNGGELVPYYDQSPEGGHRRIAKVEAVETLPDVLQNQASSDAMDLLLGCDTLLLGLELANDLKAKGRVQKMLTHQMATLHALGMRFAAKANHELQRINEASVFKSDKHRQLACVEAARLANATARMLGAYNEAALTLNKLKTGGKQVVQVQHVTVKGGQAVVGQNVRAGQKPGGQTGRGLSRKS